MGNTLRYGAGILLLASSMGCSSPPLPVRSCPLYHGTLPKSPVEPPPDRESKILSRMGRWKYFGPNPMRPDTVTMPYEDYLLLLEEGRDQRNYARELREYYSRRDHGSGSGSAGPDVHPNASEE